MFVAALASCHMLWFLSLAAAAGWRVERYVDEASGTMAANEAGRRFVADVTLRPLVVFAGARAPAPAELLALHERAHEECYIANSVKTQVLIVPRS
ncbi:MAG: OsmC family protein [Rubrivivax sp.]